MNKFIAKSVQYLIDIALMAAAFFAAYLLRFNGYPDLQHEKHLFFQLPYVVIFQFIVFAIFGIYSIIWRYVGMNEIKLFFIASIVQTIPLFILRFLQVHEYVSIPISIIIIDSILLFFGTAGVRAIRRMIMERRISNTSDKKRERVMLIGAGQAGVIVAREIANNNIPYNAIGFIDDDPMKRDGFVHGLKVLGNSNEIGKIADKYDVKKAIITIANASGATIRKIKQICEASGVKTIIIPPLYEIIGGKLNFSQLREVSIEDLLGRESVQLDKEALEAFIKDKKVAVTGAGGSIGSELCRQIYNYRPKTLILMEQAENALFNIHREILQNPNGYTEVVPTIVDVCDSRRVNDIFDSSRPQIVFHAAAHKHVPMMEWNPGEAVKNNIFGTKKIADACDKYGAEAMVFISTDKAVNPTSVMGATKRAAELYVQALSSKSNCKYIAVRFGNVLGSAGSVIPIFKEQLAKGGPLYVTHPDMVRYFMTIPEACLLVMQAATIGNKGEIFVLDMGKPVKILDLAKDLITLSGLRPYEDIDIEITGMRPGEKLFEELNMDNEKMGKTRHPKIFIGKFPGYDYDRITYYLEKLAEIKSPDPRAEHLVTLKEMIPEFSPDESRIGSTPRYPTYKG